MLHTRRIGWVVGGLCVASGLACACAGERGKAAPKRAEPVIVDVAPPAPNTTADPVSVIEAPAERVDPDLAWLRKRVPELAELRTDAPVEELLAAFQPDQTVEMFLTADKFRCAPVRVTRPAAAQALDLDIIESEQVVNGQRERKLIGGSANHWLRFGSSGSTERQRPDGSWGSAGGWGSSGGTLAGVLTEVTPDRIRFGGKPVWIRLSCPKVMLLCDAGGERACVSCDQLEAHVQRMVIHGGMGYLRAPTRRATCKEPCPEPDTSDLDRAKQLIESYEHPWLPETEAVAALYRERATCEAELSKP